MTILTNKVIALGESNFKRIAILNLLRRIIRRAARKVECHGRIVRLFSRGRDDDIPRHYGYRDCLGGRIPHLRGDVHTAHRDDNGLDRISRER